MAIARMKLKIGSIRLFTKEGLEALVAQPPVRKCAE